MTLNKTDLNAAHLDNSWFIHSFSYSKLYNSKKSGLNTTGPSTVNQDQGRIWVSNQPFSQI